MRRTTGKYNMKNIATCFRTAKAKWRRNGCPGKGRNDLKCHQPTMKPTETEREVSKSCYYSDLRRLRGNYIQYSISRSQLKLHSVSHINPICHIFQETKTKAVEVWKGNMSEDLEKKQIRDHRTRKFMEGGRLS